jgi:putative ABC transport system substrate-binding protein
MLIAALLSAFVAASAHAQDPGRTYRLGVLTMNRLNPEDLRRDMLPRLAQLGFSEGRNLIFDVRVGLADQLPGLARDLVARSDVIVVVGSDPLVAVGEATRTLPIVSFGLDPTILGLAQSVARPGGNVTGLAMFNVDLDRKQLELLHEVVPEARRIAWLTRRASLGERRDDLIRVMADAGIDLHVFYADRAEEYSAALTAMREAGMEAMVIDGSPLFTGDRARLLALAQEARLPTACSQAVMVREGCLLSYGFNLPALRLRLADYVARIFSGTSPAEMAIEWPTQFQLVVNLRAARALGITIPPTLLARADEVIE